jgi:polyribonucleotide nucleotidyltransferase
MSRDGELFRIRDEVAEKVSPSPADASLSKIAFWDVCRECMRHIVLDKGIRCDGRLPQDLREIQCEVNVFPPLHGSAVFRRGETQVFCTTTFDSLASAAKTDSISLLLGGQRSKKFMVHYEFPPFATNDVSKAAFSFGRREIGHGMLAERALQGVIPNDFPFTIRLTSQVFDSNGSSSMATICGGSLALFDAGVAVVRPVGGVACGMVSRTKADSDELEDYTILTDILGIEDALGNMDFKVAGTREGITAIQYDVKGIRGIPLSVFEEAIQKGKDGIGRVLDAMDAVQSSPRPEMKDNSPAYETIQVPIMKRSRVLGVGGHKLRALAEETGAEIQTIGNELMSVFAPSHEAMEEAKERIEALLKSDDEAELQFGNVYKVKILDIRNYGAVVEFILPHSSKRPPSALLHLSQMDHKMVRHPSVLGLRRGDVIDVKYLGKDPVTDKNRVSRKALLPSPEMPSEKDAHEVISIFSKRQRPMKHHRKYRRSGTSEFP